MKLPKTHKIPKKMKEKILLALYRYYLNDITFERAAEDANVPIYFLVKYVNDHNLPLVYTDKDVTDGIRKVVILMKREGMDTTKFPMLLPA